MLPNREYVLFSFFFVSFLPHEKTNKIKNFTHLSIPVIPKRFQIASNKKTTDKQKLFTFVVNGKNESIDFN